MAIEDVVEAHLLALDRAPSIGLRQVYRQRHDPIPPRGRCAAAEPTRAAVARERVPGWEDEYARRGWRMAEGIDRVYDNALARRELGWRPKWDFAAIVARLRETGDIRGPLAKAVGEKGYHPEPAEGRPYPVD